MQKEKGLSRRNTMNMTKAQMLINLKNNIADIHILPIFVVRSGELKADLENVMRRVISFADGRTLIVRSSSAAEDTTEFSNAGSFLSVVGVEPNKDSVLCAMQSVYNSYNTNNDEEILIQPMLFDVVKSGVIFTRDIDTNAGYYVVNYHEGGDTTAVTSGGAGSLKTFVCFRESPFPVKNHNMSDLIAVARKIEDYLGVSALDIEFAITSDNTVYVLQCRPIARGKKTEQKKTDISPVLKRIYKKAQKLSQPHPFLLGRTTCFGVMPDWNPAEILGIRPKKLAISLYKELITDSVWAHQRSDYGYRDLTMHPLMISFCGIPYIDTRITFNSFIPQNLNNRIAEKLVNYYLDRLAAYPKYHDKIEFEIVFSCYYPGLPGKLKKLLNYGFNENEITRIEFSLLELTNRIINSKTGLYLQDIEKIKKMEANIDRIEKSDISLVDRIYWLIEECKAYGTLPFAGVARAAFVAVQFLRSFVEMGVISQAQYDAYMNSLNTVNKQMNVDLTRYYLGEVSQEEFLEKYGHIRPGTYDLLSPRYDEAFDTYFSHLEGGRLSSGDNEETFTFPVDVIQRLQQELDDNGLLITANGLFDFIKASIEGREYLKFVFTKAVSRILQLVGLLGVRNNIAEEDMAHVDIGLIKQLYVDLHTGKLSDLFRQNIENNKAQYDVACLIRLPSIIIQPEDVYSFYALDEEPNFITQKNIIANTAMIDETKNLVGKVVFVRSADPGYDYLFSKNIAGLVTQFGGANSHMAIRCAELGIPAVIGVGESRYDQWSKYKKIQVDCLKRQVIGIE